ncbi:hypothetical protein, partial [Janthinobacterium rivuli]|uniref:hypothetical protein n=1 Tax=Janthinobacterium rivuli TaxID=2751478 RepID=UPI00383BD62B
MWRATVNAAAAAGGAGAFHQVLLLSGVGGHAARPCPVPARRPQRHTVPPARCGALPSTLQLLPAAPAPSTRCCCYPAWAATPHVPALFLPAGRSATRCHRHGVARYRQRCSCCRRRRRLPPGAAAIRRGRPRRTSLPCSCPPAAAPHGATGTVWRATVNAAAAAGGAGAFHQVLLLSGVGGHAARPCPVPARRPQRHTV